LPEGFLRPEAILHRSLYIKKPETTKMELIQNAVELAIRDVGVGGRGAHLVIPSLVGPVLATILVFNRIYWRISLVHTLGLDDLCITLSLVRLRSLSSVNFFKAD
jgi:hypothetical protein